MTNIEQKFFKTFGIEPEYIDGCKLNDKYFTDKQLQKEYKTFDDYMTFKCPHQNEFCYSTCQYAYDCSEYPKITDRVLLKLICILNDFEGINVKAITPEELKEELLKQCIEPFEYPIAFEEHHEIDKLYHQVRALFREEGG